MGVLDGGINPKYGNLVLFLSSFCKFKLLLIKSRHCHDTKNVHMCNCQCINLHVLGVTHQTLELGNFPSLHQGF